MNRYKPLGWRNDNYRHYLAAKYGSAGRSKAQQFFAVKRMQHEDYDEHEDVDPKMAGLLKERDRTTDQRDMMREVIAEKQRRIADPATAPAEKIRLGQDIESISGKERGAEEDLIGMDAVAHARGYWARRRSRSPSSAYVEYIRGGRADFRKDADFNARQLRRGIKHEMEHTSNPKIAKEIAKDHLAEDPKYYTHLDAMERRVVKRQKRMEKKYPWMKTVDPKNPGLTRRQASRRLKGLGVRKKRVGDEYPGIRSWS